MSNIHRETGTKQKVDTNTKKDIVLKRKGNLYKKVLPKLRTDDKKILFSLLTFMTDNTNHIIVAGDTMQAVIKDTGFAEQTIKDSLSRLNKKGLIQGSKKLLPFEYIINPLFAIKGNERDIWEFQHNIECQLTGIDRPFIWEE